MHENTCMSDFVSEIPIGIANFQSALWIADRKIRIPIEILDFQSKIQFFDWVDFFLTINFEK